MMRKVLLDTNILISAFDAEEGHPQDGLAYRRVMAWLDDPDVRLTTTPLILYEVLRGVQRVSPDELEERLAGFQVVSVHGPDGIRAAELFRFAKNEGVSLDKRSFDLFHCVCAESNRLEFESQDGDIPKIKDLMKSYPRIQGNKNA